MMHLRIMLYTYWTPLPLSRYLDGALCKYSITLHYLLWCVNNIIQVKLDQSKAEPDWLIGQKDGMEGCFPMAYVQLADNDIYPDIPTKSSAKTTAPKEQWPPNDIFPGSDAVYDTPPRSVYPYFVLHFYCACVHLWALSKHCICYCFEFK